MYIYPHALFALHVGARAALLVFRLPLKAACGRSYCDSLSTMSPPKDTVLPCWMSSIDLFFVQLKINYQALDSANQPVSPGEVFKVFVKETTTTKRSNK